MKILIYDRSLEIRYLIQKYIRQISDSTEICAVGNANMLIPEIKDTSYSVLILDIDNLNGFFAGLKELLKTEQTHTIILLTLFPDRKVVSKYLSNGANYCFDKVGEIDKFFETLKSIIGKEIELETEHNVRSIAV